MLAQKHRFSRSLGRRLEQAARTTSTRSYATVLPEHKAKVEWQAWFDSAAPYPPHPSSAAVDDRRRRSHHDRDWIAPLPLHASLAPSFESIRKDPPDGDFQSQPVTVLTPPVELQLKDENWVRKTLSYPTKQDYPAASDDLFTVPSTDSLARAFSAIKPPELVTFSKFKLVKDFEAIQFWRSFITARYPDGSNLTVRGEGFTKEDAGKASLMSLIATLHSQSQLRKVHEEPKQLLSSWKDIDKNNTSQSIIHVYNYAAHFGTIPRFTRQQEIESVSSVGDRILHRATVSVEVKPGIIISGTGIGRDSSHAERRACLDFKNKAEIMQDSIGSTNVDLQDTTTVGLDTARLVLSMFRSLRPDVELQQHGRYLNENFEDIWTYYYTHNGEILGEPVTVSYKHDASRLAELVAAVTLTKIYPDLLDRLQRAKKQTVGLLLPPEEPLPAAKLGNLSSVLPPVVLEWENQNPSDADAEPDNYNSLEMFQRRAKLNLSDKLQARQRAHTHEISMDARNESLEYAQQFYRFSPALEDIRAAREALPVSKMREQILSSIRNNTFTIIVGETGSGKSTQVPQMILEDAIDRRSGVNCNIVCTEPRRVAAKSLAQRVADERDELLGEVIGYQMAGDAMLSTYGGSITFMTPESQTLQFGGGVDAPMDNISHFIIDEAHLRDPQTDGLLTTLKLATEDRERRQLPCPKLVVMSATLDTTLFESYFGNEGLRNIETIRVPGRLYPVEELYLPDIIEEMQNTLPPNNFDQFVAKPPVKKYLQAEQLFALQQSNLSGQVEADKALSVPSIQWLSNSETDRSRRFIISADLIVATIAHILRTSSDGDILAFLPGWGDIFYIKEELERQATIDPELKDCDLKIVAMHSKRPEGLSEAISPMPDGARRVILATNIAETTVTLPDVCFIVDPGIYRRAEPHPVNGALVFRDAWICQASASQRSGRAGRVRPGRYYALFSKERRNSFEPFSPVAPLLGPFSADTMRTALRSKILFPQHSVSEYFEATLNRPSESEIDTALAELQELGVMSKKEELTYLGELLALFPRHPRYTTIVFLGVTFECLEPMLVFLLSTDEIEIYLRPENQEQSQRLFALQKHHAQGTMSDHMVVVNIYRELQRIKAEEGEEKARTWAQDNQVNFNFFLLLERQVEIYTLLLVRRGIIPQVRSCNANANDSTLVQSLITAALWPNVAIHSQRDRFWTPKGVTAALRRSSPLQVAYSSAVAHGSTNPASIFKDKILCFSGWSTIVGRVGRLTRVTPVTPLALVLFGGKLTLKPGTEDVLLLDDWFALHVSSKEAAQNIIRFKNAWTKVWRNAVKSYARGVKPGPEGQRDVFARTTFVQRVIDLIHVENSNLDLDFNRTTTVEEVDGQMQYKPFGTNSSNEPDAHYLRRSRRTEDGNEELERDDHIHLELGRSDSETIFEKHEVADDENDAEEDEDQEGDDELRAISRSERPAAETETHSRPSMPRMAYPEQQYGRDATSQRSRTRSKGREIKKEDHDTNSGMSELPHEV